jgi:hypothetical protein
MNDVDLTLFYFVFICSFERERKKKEMNFVRVSGSIGLTSLWISVLSYFLSLILYIISFCLPDWVVYTSIPIKIGIWRLCDTEVCFISFCKFLFKNCFGIDNWL